MELSVELLFQRVFRSLLLLPTTSVSVALNSMSDVSEFHLTTWLLFKLLALFPRGVALSHYFPGYRRWYRMQGGSQTGEQQASRESERWADS